MTRPYTEDQKPKHPSLLLKALTYWDEPDRRDTLIRIVMGGAVLGAVAAHHLLPVAAGLIVSGILYFRS